MEPILIKEFLPTNVLGVSYQYVLMKYSNYKFDDFDLQSNSIVSEHSDYLMETLLDITTPVIESNVRKKLWPTYSYLRIYDKGSDLPVHTDRGSCEYTVALCLGCDPIDKPYELFVGNESELSDYKYFDDRGNYNRYEIKNKISMMPNDALIFKGMENVHWREMCTHDHYVTVFLHYVDQEGPYKEYKFDKRNSLGEKK